MLEHSFFKRVIFFDFNVAFPANSVVFKARLIVRWKDCNEYYDIVYLNVENRFEKNVYTPVYYHQVSHVVKFSVIFA